MASRASKRESKSKETGTHPIVLNINIYTNSHIQKKSEKMKTPNKEADFSHLGDNIAGNSFNITINLNGHNNSNKIMEYVTEMVPNPVTQHMDSTPMEQDVMHTESGTDDESLSDISMTHEDYNILGEDPSHKKVRSLDSGAEQIHDKLVQFSNSFGEHNLPVTVQQQLLQDSILATTFTLQGWDTAAIMTAIYGVSLKKHPHASVRCILVNVKRYRGRYNRLSNLAIVKHMVQWQRSIIDDKNKQRMPDKIEILRAFDVFSQLLSAKMETILDLMKQDEANMIHDLRCVIGKVWDVTTQSNQMDNAKRRLAACEEKMVQWANEAQSHIKQNMMAFQNTLKEKYGYDYSPVHVMSDSTQAINMLHTYTNPFNPPTYHNLIMGGGWDFAKEPRQAVERLLTLPTDQLSDNFLQRLALESAAKHDISQSNVTVKIENPMLFIIHKVDDSYSHEMEDSMTEMTDEQETVHPPQQSREQEILAELLASSAGVGRLPYKTSSPVTNENINEVFSRLTPKRYDATNTLEHTADLFQDITRHSNSKIITQYLYIHWFNLSKYKTSQNRSLNTMAAINAIQQIVNNLGLPASSPPPVIGYCVAKVDNVFMKQHLASLQNRHGRQEHGIVVKLQARHMFAIVGDSPTKGEAQYHQIQEVCIPSERQQYGERYTVFALREPIEIYPLLQDQGMSSVPTLAYFRGIPQGTPGLSLQAIVISKIQEILQELDICPTLVQFLPETVRYDTVIDDEGRQRQIGEGILMAKWVGPREEYSAAKKAIGLTNDSYIYALTSLKPLPFPIEYTSHINNFRGNVGREGQIIQQSTIIHNLQCTVTADRLLEVLLSDIKNEDIIGEISDIFMVPMHASQKEIHSAAAMIVWKGEICQISTETCNILKSHVSVESVRAIPQITPPGMEYLSGIMRSVNIQDSRTITRTSNNTGRGGRDGQNRTNSIVKHGMVTTSDNSMQAGLELNQRLGEMHKSIITTITDVQALNDSRQDLNDSRHRLMQAQMMESNLAANLREARSQGQTVQQTLNNISFQIRHASSDLDDLEDKLAEAGDEKTAARLETRIQKANGVLEYLNNEQQVLTNKRSTIDIEIENGRVALQQAQANALLQQNEVHNHEDRLVMKNIQLALPPPMPDGVGNEGVVAKINP